MSRFSYTRLGAAEKEAEGAWERRDREPLAVWQTSAAAQSAQQGGGTATGSNRTVKVLLMSCVLAVIFSSMPHPHRRLIVIFSKIVAPAVAHVALVSRPLKVLISSSSSFSFVTCLEARFLLLSSFIFMRGLSALRYNSPTSLFFPSLYNRCETAVMCILRVYDEKCGKK